jgi:F-box and leucine-rich repeat protein GRR1
MYVFLTILPRVISTNKRQGIHELLVSCRKLTHLSLTGISEFFSREDILNFCREAPPG